MQRMHYFGGLGFRVFFSARPRCVKVVKVTLGASETMGFPDSFPTYLFGHGPPFLNPSARDDAPATPTTQPNPKRSEDNDAGMNQPAPLAPVMDLMDSRLTRTSLQLPTLRKRITNPYNPPL